MSLPIAEPQRFAAELAASPERWEHAVHHADDSRAYELICDDGDVNAWFTCWSVSLSRSTSRCVPSAEPGQRIG